MVLWGFWGGAPGVLCKQLYPKEEQRPNMSVQSIVFPRAHGKQSSSPRVFVHDGIRFGYKDLQCYDVLHFGLMDCLHVSFLCTKTA